MALYRIDRPFRQGDLDNTSALYSILNAIGYIFHSTITYPELSSILKRVVSDSEMAHICKMGATDTRRSVIAEEIADLVGKWYPRRKLQVTSADFHNWTREAFFIECWNLLDPGKKQERSCLVTVLPSDPNHHVCVYNADVDVLYQTCIGLHVLDPKLGMTYVPSPFFFRECGDPQTGSVSILKFTVNPL